jgi:hypothetical protein
MTRVAVLLTEADNERFEAFCRERGHKKSTLIARLIRDHLDSEGYASQPELFRSGGKAMAAADTRPIPAKGQRKQ